MGDDKMTLLTGVVVTDSHTISIKELSKCCLLTQDEVLKMVQYGIIEPIEIQETQTHWQFAYTSVLRVQTASRLQRDLGVNLAGAALALDLLDEIKKLRQLTNIEK